MHRSARFTDGDIAFGERQGVDSRLTGITSLSLRFFQLF